MAGLDKYFSLSTTTGLTIYVIIQRNADDYRLNDADGSFALAPADPYLLMVESTTIPGLYEVTENRVGWNNGEYIIQAYSQLGGSPAPTTDTIIGSIDFIVDGDYIQTPTVGVITGVLSTLINSLRSTTRDIDNGTSSELLWTDDDWIEYLNEGEREIAKRTHCIFDRTTDAVCDITLTTNVSLYSISSKILFVERLIPSWAPGVPIVKKTRKWLDDNYPGWRALVAGEPIYFIEENTHTITLVPAPSVTYNTNTLLAEVRRYPLVDLSVSNTSPEIDFRFYAALKEYALYRAYLKKDSQALDPKSSATHFALFNSLVGPGYDGNIERTMKEEPADIQFGVAF